jgi:hypothetical protein
MAQKEEAKLMAFTIMSEIYYLHATSKIYIYRITLMKCGTHYHYIHGTLQLPVASASSALKDFPSI